DYASFGRDLGQVWRQALSEASPAKQQEPKDPVPVGSKSPTSSDEILEVTSALLLSFFGHGTDGHDLFLWERPLSFNKCIQQEVLQLQAVWSSVGDVLRAGSGASPSARLWSFSTPDEQVTHQEVQKLAELGQILQKLPGILGDCGLHGTTRQMFQQSLAVFKKPPKPILGAAASSLLALQQHWQGQAWQ
ncbi:unnamed protein product, partial [Effrenium voratum]